jgi:hypothetical protein
MGLKGLALVAAVAATWAAFVAVVAGSQVDTRYRRFTVPARPSLILGSSKAAFGLRPDALNRSPLVFARPIMNYAFSLRTSPYGPIYLRSIKRKLKTGQRNGLFILEVDPFGLSYYPVANPREDPALFREVETILDRQRFVSLNPNFEYLLRHYKPPYIQLLIDRLRAPKSFHLHADGWIEYQHGGDADKVAERRRRALAEYAQVVMEMRPSKRRWRSLRQTIGFLSGYGRVVLLRMPISCEFLQLEMRYQADFNERLRRLASTMKISFYDEATDCGKWPELDGHHLKPQSAVRFSRLLVARLSE